MAIVNLPTGFEGFGADMARLGDSLARTLFPSTIKDAQVEQMVLQNPELGQMLAGMYREQGEGAGQALGISPRLMTQLGHSFTPTIQEELNKRLRGSESYVDNLVAAEEIAPRVRTATGEAEIAEAGARIPGAELARQGALEAIRHNIPALQAMAQAGQLEVLGRMSEAELENNLPEARALMEAFNIDLNTAQGQFALQNMNEYREWVKTIHPHLRGVATAAMVNPGLASHILAHEQMSFQEQMERLRLEAQEGAIDPLERATKQFNLSKALRGEVTDALDRLRVARDKGNEVDRLEAVADLENLAGWQRQLIGTGVLPVSNVFTAEIRDRWIRSGLPESRIEAPQVGQAFQDIINQGGTVQEMLSSPAWSTYSHFLPPEVKNDLIQSATQGVQPEAAEETPGPRKERVAPQQRPAIPDQLQERIKTAERQLEMLEREKDRLSPNLYNARKRQLEGDLSRWRTISGNIAGRDQVAGGR